MPLAGSMDSLSITTGCFAASNAVSKTSPALRLFIREVRESRAELDGCLSEIHSLDGVLDILKDDATSFPADLARRTPPLLEHCTKIMNQMEGYMHVCNGMGLSTRDKKYRWLAIKGDMVKLRVTLEGYKSILAVVSDLVGLTRSCKQDDRLSTSSDSSRHAEAVETRAASKDDIRNDLTHVMADMGTLRGRLQSSFKSNYAVSDLENYINAMHLQATGLSSRLDVQRLETADAPHIPRRAAGRDDRQACNTSNSSSAGDEPDSAIDMNDGPPSLEPQPKTSRKFPLGTPTPPRSVQDKELPEPPANNSLPMVEIDEFLGELGEMPASRPPSPPPRARNHRNSLLSSPQPQQRSLLSPSQQQGLFLQPFVGGTLPGISRDHSPARSVSDYGANVARDPEGRVAVPNRMSSIRRQEESDEALSTLGDLMTIRAPHHDVDTGFDGGRAVITTTIVGGPAAWDSGGETSSRPSFQESRLVRSTSRSASRLFGRKNSFSVPARPTRTGSALGHFGVGDTNASTDTSRPDTAAGGVTPNAAADTGANKTREGGHLRPSSSSTRADSVRSNSSRISSVISRVSFWKSRRDAVPAVAEEEDPEPDGVFGVTLKKSLQMASASVRTHHDGSKSSSRREFPRCVLMCATFVRDNGGVRAPNIFGGDFSIGGCAAGDSMVRVAALKEVFSEPPYYGEGNIDWAAHDVYDAAELIVLFLQQLRKPLITEAVAKRWIVLSKQATLPGSMGRRLDSCIDFWDEALLGVRGPARSLFKLLLNLWGDVADAAELNDMTAERLAARLLNPLMHLPAGKYTTDYMLGLAFLIRKRSEYTIMLREGRESHAAF